MACCEVAWSSGCASLSRAWRLLVLNPACCSWPVCPTAEGAYGLQAHWHRPLFREDGEQGRGATPALTPAVGGVQGRQQQVATQGWLDCSPLSHQAAGCRAARPPPASARQGCPAPRQCLCPPLTGPHSPPAPLASLQVSLVDALCGAHFHLPHLDERVLEVSNGSRAG